MSDRLFDAVRQLAAKSKASQDEFELWQLMLLAIQTAKDDGHLKVLEVGVHRGGFLETMREFSSDAELTGIEINPEFLEFHDFHLIQGDSAHPHVVKLARERGPYDIIFIDGDHHYEAVRKDWEVYAKMGKPGTIVGFHDIMRMPGEFEGVEVRRFFDELKQTGRTIEFWGGPGAPGTGVVIL